MKLKSSNRNNSLVCDQYLKWEQIRREDIEEYYIQTQNIDGSFGDKKLALVLYPHCMIQYFTEKRFNEDKWGNVLTLDNVLIASKLRPSKARQIVFLLAMFGYKLYCPLGQEDLNDLFIIVKTILAQTIPDEWVALGERFLLKEKMKV